MADVYKEQAQFFANVPLMQSGVVASVHLEDGDDKDFWNAMLQIHYCKKANVCHDYWSKEGNWRIFFYTRFFLAG